MRPRRILKCRHSLLFSIAAVTLATTTLASAQNTTPAATLPRMEGETLSSKKIVLPDDARGKIALLAIGFSKKGGDTSRAWGDRFKKDFSTDPRYALYPVAVLEDAPRFVRGMILGGMRRGVPAQEQDRFVTLFQGEADLKRFVGFSAESEAYLLLLDAKGEIQWHGHGFFTEQEYAALAATAKKLGAQ